MNKHSAITAIAIIVIIIPILYGIWGIFSVEQLQLSTPNDEFSYFEMSNYEQIQICNPMPFFVSFNGLTIATYFTNDLKGVFEIGPTTIDPNTLEVLEVDFSSENFAESQYLFMHMDGQFDGEIPIRLDPSKMIVVTNFETKIIGIIPYQSTITQSGFDFTKMMNKDSSCEND
ncbi:MAG TPA: thr operon leader peptide [Nitrosopumilaceae archaeon]|nr:thr operon leader peptide [Nitrosopumilaceae archaeon]